MATSDPEANDRLPDHGKLDAASKSNLNILFPGRTAAISNCLPRKNWKDACTREPLCGGSMEDDRKLGGP